MSDKREQNERKDAHRGILQKFCELLTGPNMVHPDPRLNRYRFHTKKPYAKPLIQTGVPQSFPSLTRRLPGESSRTSKPSNQDQGSKRKPVILGDLHNQIMSGQETKPTQEKKKKPKKIYASCQRNLF